MGVQATTTPHTSHVWADTWGSNPSSFTTKSSARLLSNCTFRLRSLVWNVTCCSHHVLSLKESTEILARLVNYPQPFCFPEYFDHCIFLCMLQLLCSSQMLYLYQQVTQSLSVDSLLHGTPCIGFEKQYGNNASVMCYTSIHDNYKPKESDCSIKAALIPMQQEIASPFKYFQHLDPDSWWTKKGRCMQIDLKTTQLHQKQVRESCAAKKFLFSVM